MSKERENIPPKDRDCCRNDRKGQHWDKQAMQKASEALGHNRIDVIAGHYLK